jgi:4-amino-4-deoxy-L-arabinose transferase-like glycosyltransferase
MGLILVAGMAAGCAVGLIITAILGGLGVVLTIKIGKSRGRVWWYFAVAFVVAVALLILGVYHYPYAPARPGSDYDTVMKNSFLQGLGYCASLGLAAFLAALATLLAPMKPKDK